MNADGEVVRHASHGGGLRSGAQRLRLPEHVPDALVGHASRIAQQALPFVEEGSSCRHQSRAVSTPRCHSLGSYHNVSPHTPARGCPWVSSWKTPPPPKISAICYVALRFRSSAATSIVQRAAVLRPGEPLLRKKTWDLARIAQPNARPSRPSTNTARV
jgi:hypothetical protein